MNRWWKANCWAGYAVFGIPAALAVPAVITTASRFGPIDTLTSATLPVLWILSPLALWVRYTRRRPRTRRGAAAWIAVALLSLGLLLTSPIWFWSGLTLLVLASEALRAVVSRTSGQHLGQRQSLVGAKEGR